MKFTLPDPKDQADLAFLRRELAQRPYMDSRDVARLIELHALAPPPVVLPCCPGCEARIPTHFSSCHEGGEHDSLCLFLRTGGSCDCGAWKRWLDEKWREVDNSRPSPIKDQSPNLSQAERAARDFRRFYLALHGAIPIGAAPPETSVLLTEEAPCERFHHEAVVLPRGATVFLVRVDGEQVLITHRDGDGLIPKDTMVFLPEESNEP